MKKRISKKKGNCYRFATTFAYIAKALGYNSRVCVGGISDSAYAFRHVRNAIYNMTTSAGKVIWK